MILSVKTKNNLHTIIIICTFANEIIIENER
jgi:hypothetical protein